MRGGMDESEISARFALSEWRQKATNLLLSASAVLYLPAILLLLAGHGPPISSSVEAVTVAAYLVVVVCAVLRNTSFRARVWSMMACAYLLAVVVGAAMPQGPFARSVPVLMPLLAMVLLGAREALGTGVASAFVLLFSPFLRNVPGIAELIATDPPAPLIPPDVLLTQGVVMTGMLGATLVLLDRFYRLLRQSMRSLEREAIERTEAHRNLESEMRETRRLERELAGAGDEERHRLGLDIHDGVCQQLTGALLRCEALARRVERGEKPTAADLTALSSLIEEAINEAHAVARGLCLLDSDPGALEVALRTLVKRTQRSGGIACRFAASGDVRVFDPATARHLYRVAQEAVSNAARHADANRITLRLSGTPDELLLQVEDNGSGIPAGLSRAGMGLRTMAYRARLMDGELTVAPALTGGTCVSCRVPRGGVVRAGVEEAHYES